MPETLNLNSAAPCQSIPYGRYDHHDPFNRDEFEACREGVRMRSWCSLRSHFRGGLWSRVPIRHRWRGVSVAHLLHILALSWAPVQLSLQLSRASAESCWWTDQSQGLGEEFVVKNSLKNWVLGRRVPYLGPMSVTCSGRISSNINNVAGHE